VTLVAFTILLEAYSIFTHLGLSRAKALENSASVQFASSLANVEGRI
jgi:hypothetical protein